MAAVTPDPPLPAVTTPTDQVRDRDATGRPTNARMRDALGRPLPRGVPGYLGEPQEPLTGPQDALDRAQAFLDGGRAFAAHEVLEAAWKAAPAAERQLWQGLAQLAVGHTHLQRGNGTGALRLLRRGAGRLAAVEVPAPHGIAVRELLATARQTEKLLEAGVPTEKITARLCWLLRG